MSASRTFWFVWRVPLVLGLLTIFGLLVALLGAETWHWASWVTMSIPLAVIVFHTLRRPRAAGR
jgi:hypothetical protein